MLKVRESCERLCYGRTEHFSLWLIRWIRLIERFRASRNPTWCNNTWSIFSTVKRLHRKKKDQFQPHFRWFSKMQLFIWLNVNLLLPLLYQKIPLTKIIHHSINSLFFYSCLKLKNLLHKSIFMEQKCKNLKLRGFAHLGKAFIKKLGKKCQSKMRLERGNIFYSGLIWSLWSWKYQCCSPHLRVLRGRIEHAFWPRAT